MGTTSGADSMYNTPACFTMYVMGEYLKYSKSVGGVAHWEEISARKSGMLYDTIDSSDGFYACPVQADSRSRMNVPFTIAGDDADLTKKFLEEAKKVSFTHWQVTDLLEAAELLCTTACLSRVLSAS